MNITFDHLSLSAKKPEKMKDFLIDLLGFELGTRPNLSFDGYFLFSGEKDLIHIFKQHIIENTESTSTTHQLPPHIVHHVSFATDNYNEIMQRIAALNIPYAMNNLPDSNKKQIFVRGPEALLIEIQATPE